MTPKQKPYRTPHNREVMAGSKLEISMLEYSLKEANGKLEKKQAELDRISSMLERTTAVADQREKKLKGFTEVTQKLTVRLTRWKLAAIVEGIVIITYMILQGVG